MLTQIKTDTTVKDGTYYLAKAADCWDEMLVLLRLLKANGVKHSLDYSKLVDVEDSINELATSEDTERRKQLLEELDQKVRYLNATVLNRPLIEEADKFNDLGTRLMSTSSDLLINFKWARRLYKKELGV